KKVGSTDTIKTESQNIIHANKGSNKKSIISGYSFKMNTLQIIFSKICCCFTKWKKRSKLFMDAENKINFYMDVLTYIKKMQEVDILKYLLLSPDQLDLFSFMTKPSVIVHEIKNEVYKGFEEEQKRSLSLNRDEIEKIF